MYIKFRWSRIFFCTCTFCFPKSVSLYLKSRCLLGYVVDLYHWFQDLWIEIVNTGINQNQNNLVRSADPAAVRSWAAACVILWGSICNWVTWYLLCIYLSIWTPYFLNANTVDHCKYIYIYVCLVMVRWWWQSLVKTHTWLAHQHIYIHIPCDTMLIGLFSYCWFYTLSDISMFIQWTTTNVLTIGRLMWTQSHQNTLEKLIWLGGLPILQLLIKPSSTGRICVKTCIMP